MSLHFLFYITYCTFTYGTLHGCGLRNAAKYISCTRQWSKCLSIFPIELLGINTNPAKSAWNLRVIFHKNFIFRSHISTVCSSCFHHIWDLRHIRHYLYLDGANVLATALVSSHLNYCYSLLYGIADTNLTKIKCVQNWLARTVTKWPPIYLQCHGSTASLVASKIEKYRSRSVCWPTKPFMKNSVFIFTPCLLHHSHLIQWDQTKDLVC